MALIDSYNIGANIQVVTADADPRTSGVDVPVGSLLLLTDGSASFFKSGALTTDWSLSLLGNGTSGKIPKFTGSGVIGDGGLSDSGTQITSSLPLVLNSSLTAANLLLYQTVGATASITWAGASNTTEAAIRITGNTPNSITNTYDAVTVPIIARTLTVGSAGTHNFISQFAIQSLVVNTNAAAVTNAATLYVQGAATGTQTITNNYALWIDDGNVRLDGTFELQGIPAKSAETNVLYYDTTTKRVAYGTISSGTTTNSLTFNNAGSGATSGSTFNGSAAVTVSWNTLGALPQARTTTTASTATLTPDISTGDVFTITAQAAALSVANPTGTPYNGQKMIIRIKDNATARAITWSGTQYRASSDLSLPTTTILSRTMYLGFIYNSTDTKWDLIAKLDNFA